MESRIAYELGQLREEIPAGVRLVAVSKFKPVDDIRAAYAAGQRLFGESRVQELLEKMPVLPDDIKWHFIGHLQTNKVRQLMGKVSLIESVDSEKLIRLIDAESVRAGVTTNILMQIHVAQEETKFGFSPEEFLSYFREGKFTELQAVHICGVMGMASNTDDMSHVRRDFAEIYRLYREVADDESLGLRGFDTVSMGMSGDWRIAVEEGADMIRIGSRIFGERNYN